MAIPPTLNDLNRVKSNLVNPIRRFPIATTGENFIDIKLNSFQMPDVIAVDSTNSLALSGDISFSPFNLNTGDFIVNTINENNTVFYPGSIEVSRAIGGDKVTDSPNHVLYYQDTKPIEVSNNFVQPLPDNDFEIRVSFYNEENFKTSTASFTISVVKFDETDKSKMFQLSGEFTDTQVVTISTDKFQTSTRDHGGRLTSLGFRISLLDKANKRFLSNGLLLTDPVSVFKDDIFLTSINEKFYPRLSYSRPLLGPGAPPGSGSVKTFSNNNPREFIFSLDTITGLCGNKLPLSSSNLVEELKTNPGKIFNDNALQNHAIGGQGLSGLEDFKYSLGAYKNRGLEDGVIVYSSYLSAGNYEFKFNLRDQDNRFNNNNITTTIPFNVVEVERDMFTPSLSTIFSAVSTNPQYTNFNHLKLFSDTPDSEGATWNTNFWAYTARDIFNFSGIHWVGNENATLITPRHAICAEHWRAFGGGKEVGDILYFNDHTTGNSVSAVIDKVFNLDDIAVTAPQGSNPYALESDEGTNYRSISAFFNIDDLTNSIEDLSGSVGTLIQDCTLVHLDRDVVSGNDIKAYPIARRIHPDYAPNKYPAIVTGGRNRQSNGDNVGLGSLSIISRQMGDQTTIGGDIHGPMGPTLIMGPPEGASKFDMLHATTGALTATCLSGIFTDTTLLTAYDFGNSKAGDSGNPNFVVLNDKLCLVMVNHSAGIYNARSEYLPSTDQVLSYLGPDYTSADTHVVLQSAVDLIGNTEGYRISAVDMV